MNTTAKCHNLFNFNPIFKVFFGHHPKLKNNDVKLSKHFLNAVLWFLEQNAFLDKIKLQRAMWIRVNNDNGNFDILWTFQLHNGNQ